MAVWWHVICYIALYAATNITNKYVLSTLHFTYPTLFQGWQTLVGYMIIQVFALLGYIKLAPLDSKGFRQWLPAGILFVVIIYSGSRALSRIPLPAFVVQHNTVEMVVFLGEWWVTGRSPSNLNQAGLLLIVASAVGIWISDPQLNPSGYKWMLVHVVSSSLYTLYTTVRQPLLTDTSRVCYNYLISVLILATGCYFLGDVSAWQDYPYWDLYQFRTGCLLSGVLGATLTLFYLALKESTVGAVSTNMALAIAKLTLVVTSLYVFDVTYTAQFTLCIVGGIVGHWLTCLTKPQLQPLDIIDDNDKESEL